jgi:TPR repeat protein
MSSFPRDPTKFVKYSARGCELGAPSACTNLAKAYAAGFGVAQDRPRAEALFARAAHEHRARCQAGDADDCYMLGYAYEHGEGVAPDPAKAAASKQRACGLGHHLSCLLLAIDARASGDAGAAVRWFGVTCERTCSAGCEEVREALKQGVPAALRLSETWRSRCARGETAACRARGAVQPTKAATPD